MSLQKQLEKQKGDYASAVTRLEQAKQGATNAADYFVVRAAAENLAHYAKVVSLTLEQMESDVIA